MSAPRVLVTGGRGLIGRQLVRQLLGAGHEVICIARGGATPDGARLIRADLLDGASRRAALDAAQAQHLVHLAWHSGEGRWHSDENARWADATISLMEEFAARGGQRAVAAGSCAEYDWARADHPLRESDPLAPATAYGRAKARAGQTLSAAPPAGLSIAWGRIFFCYGPGEPPGRLLGDLLHGISSGQEVPCTDGAQRRDFLHTADVAGALIAVLKSDLEGPVNIASGKAIAVRDLIETAARRMGRPDLARLGAIARPADDPPLIEADISRLKGTGFAPRFDLESGIQDCIDALPREGRP